LKSAFLLTDGRWWYSTNIDEVLNHDGEMFVNEDDDERDMNVQLIGAQEGKEALFRHNAITLTDSTLHLNMVAAFNELEASGSALVSYLSSFVSAELPKGQGMVFTFQTWNNEVSEAMVKWRGIIAVRDGDFWRLTRDEELWSAADAMRVRRVRKAKIDRLKTRPCAAALGGLAMKLSLNMDTGYPKSFRMEQTVVWLAAHDAAFGKRATNKLALECAQRWCNDRSKSKKWLHRWASEESVDRLDVRFAAICRLGDRNSRHQGRLKA